MRHATIQLSEHRRRGAFGGWKKNVGGKTWFFGAETSRDEAERRALLVVAAWEHLVCEGGTHWTPKAVRAVKALWTSGYSTAVSTVAQALDAHERVKADAPACSLTFHEAVNLFKQKVHADPSLSFAWRANLSDRAQKLKAALPDIPLQQVGFDEVTRLVNHFAALPVSPSRGRQIGVETAVNLIKAARQLFVWLADSGRWSEPRRFDRIFRINRCALARNSASVRTPEIITYTTEELITLWRVATTNQRLLMGLGLFCGWTQADLATATEEMFHLDSKSPFVRRRRNKTHVLGKWRIPAILASLIKQRINQDKGNSHGLAFVTEEGHPLVWRHTSGYRIDSVLQSWVRLTGKCGIKKPFKALRKTGSSVVRQMSGLDLAQTFLAHAPQSVAEAHYTPRDFDALERVLQRWHAEFVPQIGDQR